MDTIGSLFERSLARCRDRVAIATEEAQLTYGDLDRWSLAIVDQLVKAGVGAGDVVALYMRNTPAFVAADIAVARLGAVKLPVNFMLPAATVSYILATGRAAVVVSGTSLAAEITEALVTVSGVTRLEVDDGGGTTSGGSVSALAACPDASEAISATAFTVRPADAPAAMYFTGGTTGRPKGVLHTQASTVALHIAQLLEAEIHEDDRLLLMTPLAHAAGLFAQSAILRGATIVLRDGFDAERTVTSLEEERVTWTFLVPTMIYRMLDVLASRGAPTDTRLRTIVYGAAPITPRRLGEALERFGRVFIQLYGQTESPNWGTRLTKSDHDVDRPELLSSCGRASIAAEVAIVDEHGERVPAGEIGEVWLRTPYLLREYVDDPVATAEKFLRGGIRTGDLGVLDDDGYLYLRDRKNDMVVTGGMNVYCQEVESVLGEHPDVAAVAVIGIPHADWGEAVHAVVVPRSESLDVAALLAWARPRLAAYAVPKGVDAVTSLPETPFGKVDKKALRAPYWADSSRSIG